MGQIMRFALCLADFDFRLMVNRDLRDEGSNLEDSSTRVRDRQDRHQCTEWCEQFAQHLRVRRT